MQAVVSSARARVVCENPDIWTKTNVSNSADFYRFISSFYVFLPKAEEIGRNLQNLTHLFWSSCPDFHLLEFSAYEGDVELKGLALLTSIEAAAFSLLTGGLAGSGDYPALKTVGSYAFYAAGTVESTITVSDESVVMSHSDES